MSREYTCKVLEMVDNGLVDKDQLIRDLLMYLSEAEVENFCESYLTEHFDEDED